VRHKIEILIINSYYNIKSTEMNTSENKYKSEDTMQYIICDKKGQQNITTLLVLPLTLALVPVIVGISVTATVLSIPYGLCSKVLSPQHTPLKK